MARRELARRSLRRFLPIFYPDLIFNWFHETLDNALLQFLQDVEAKRSPRLIIEAPPRHSKSLFTTRGLTPFLLGRHPEWEIVAACATQELASYFGREIRRTINSPEYRNLFPATEPDPSSNSIDQMLTTRHGGYWLVGVGGQLTGVGGHVVLMDDLIKSKEVADSEVEMARVWEWFHAVAMTRLSPGGGVILMHTRWGIQDVIGRVLAADPTGWKRLTFPALAVEDEPHRRKGEALQPGRYTTKMLEKVRDDLVKAGRERDWMALYQQSPVSDTGVFFKSEWLNYVPIPQFPERESLTWYIGVDLAASLSSAADKTCFMPIGMDHEGNCYAAPDTILDRMEFLTAASKLCDLIEKYRPMWVACEKGPLHSAFGPILRAEMRRRQIFCTIKEISRTQGKHIYAAPVQARMQSKAFFFPNTNQFTLEIAPQFLNYIPGNENQTDDAIDAAANLFATMDKMAGPLPPAPPPEPTAEEEEETQWDKLMDDRDRLNSWLDRAEAGRAPFTKLNGDPIERRKDETYT